MLSGAAGVFKSVYLPVLFFAAIALPASSLSAAFSRVLPGLSTGRSQHSATLLPNGTVLIAGGATSGGFVASAELFNPWNGTVSPLTMSSARLYHTATLMPNGKVLLAGGATSATTITDVAEIFDPAGSTFSAAARLDHARFGHTATVLANGRILIAGGNTLAGNDLTLEIFDPATSTSTLLTATLTAGRLLGAASLLPNGKVLISGGIDEGIGSTTADVFNPADGSVVSVSMTGGPRSAHSSTLLANGKVLVAGGFDNAALNHAELFDPATNTFTAIAGTMKSPRGRHSATLLPTGQVLLVGGRNETELATSEVYDPASGAFAASSAMAAARQDHTATLLTNGTVLITGGEQGGPTQSSGIEVYDLPPVHVAPAGALSVARELHSSTPLPDGRVLIAGGRRWNGSSWDTHASAEIFDPAANATFAVPAMLVARSGHTATLLADGKVLLTGGFASNGAPLASAEFFDTQTGGFASAGNLQLARAGHTASVLASGRVLIAGGLNAAGPAEIYDPVSRAFRLTSGSTQSKRDFHRATLLLNGKVLLAGGEGAPAPMELFDPASETFAYTAGTSTQRSRPTATVLPDGKVLIAGTDVPSGVPTADLYDPESGNTTFGGTLVENRTDHSAIGLPDGTVLFFGGLSAQNVERYDAVNRRSIPVAPMIAPMRFPAVTLLRDGRVLVTGGRHGTVFGTLNAAFTYDPMKATDPARRPVVNPTGPICQPGTLSLTGTGFTGNTEGSSGAWQSSAANAPKLRLQHVDGGQVRLLPTSAWSATSLTVPSIGTLPVGVHRLSVVSNGIPSMEQLVVAGKTGTTIGTYGARSTVAGRSITNAPSAAPALADATARLTASVSDGFLGSVSIDATTGVVAIDRAGPVGTHTVTVTVTSACSALSRSFPLTVTAVPPPVIQATAIDASTIRLSWNTVADAAEYDLYFRVQPGPMQFLASTTYTGGDLIAYENASFAFQVKSKDIYGGAGPFGNQDIATTVVFTTEPIVKAAHQMQLRTAVNAVRTLAGLPAFTFTDANLTGVTVKSIHLLDLRNALNEARAALGLSAWTYPTSIAPGAIIRRTALTEIQNGVE